MLRYSDNKEGRRYFLYQYLRCVYIMFGAVRNMFWFLNGVMYFYVLFSTNEDQRKFMYLKGNIIQSLCSMP